MGEMRAPSAVERRGQAHRPSVVAHLFGFDHLLRLHIDVQCMASLNLSLFVAAQNRAK
jgi:hypothetical protein